MLAHWLTWLDPDGPLVGSTEPETERTGLDVAARSHCDGRTVPAPRLVGLDGQGSSRHFTWRLWLTPLPAAGLVSATLRSI
jgi:hypothetical protein